MQKIFYYVLAFSLIIFSLNSCSSSLSLIKNKFTFNENFKINDSSIYKKIDEYNEFYSNKIPELSIVIICSKENLSNQKINEYYISSINQDSYLINQPCTGSFVYKDKIILVYSKKIGFINPVNYPVKFLNKIKKNLINNWYCFKENCKSNTITLTGVVVTGEEQINKINNGITTKIKHFDLWNYCYGEKRFSYTNYVNLDNFRTIYVEDCED